MTDLTAFVYKEGDKFYFDPENYTGDIDKNLSIEYEDGDMIKWVWEDQKMAGTLRSESNNIRLFVVKNVIVIK